MAFTLKVIIAGIIGLVASLFYLGSFYLFDPNIETATLVVVLTFVIAIAGCAITFFFHGNEVSEVPIVFGILIVLGLILYNINQTYFDDLGLWGATKAGFWTFGASLIIAWGPILLTYTWRDWKESPSFRQWFSVGRGKNALWAGPGSMQRMSFDLHDINGKVKTSGIYLGRPLLPDLPYKMHLQMKDDAHHVTIAAPGSGKSISAVWPTLTMYQGPVVVLDPKGEHARYSAGRRTSNNWGEDRGESPTKVDSRKRIPKGNTYILDPYGNAKPFEGMQYNPLYEIQINSDGARGLIQAISDGCVLDEGGKDIHFTEAARTIIEGVIAHVLSRYPASEQTLPKVADLFRGFDPELGIADPQGFDDVIAEMTTDDAAGGLPMDAANLLLNAGSRERGSMLTTCARSLKWVNDPPMRRHLSGGPNFPMIQRLIGSGSSDTLYIVLPLEYMDANRQVRWMRVMTNLINVHLFRNPRTGEKDHKLLFVLDEFYKLGYMRMIEEGFVTARGAGARYWILVQDLGQLKARYDKNWETFLGSSNVQLFGISDNQTAEWAAAALGGIRDSGTNNYPLMRPDEVRQFLGKDDPTQIVVRATGAPLRLERLAHKPIKNYKSLKLEGLYDEF